MPAFVIVGLPDRACNEARQRVKSGITSAELKFPRGRVTVNLAPAGLRKEGSGYDLPIALAVLAASRQLPHDELDRHAAVGELALDGRLRRVGGVLAVAEGARRMGLECVLCPSESAAEAALAGIEPIPVRHLADAVAYLRGELEPDPVVPPRRTTRRRCPTSRTSADRSARGARSRSRPRAGTTSCSPGRRARARRCSRGACPASCRRSSREAALEVTRIHSVAGLLAVEQPLVTRAAVPRAAPQRLDRGDRRRRRRHPPGRGEPRAPRRPAARRAGRVPRDRRSRRCASRSRTASSRSRAPPGARSSRRASSSSRR